MEDSIINYIKQKCENSMVDPRHVTYKELYKKFGDVKDTLNKLCREDKITWGHTLNDIYFKIL